MTEKKVLAIIYTSSFGGPHNQIKQLNRGLKALGYRYDLCVPSSEQAYQKELVEQNVSVYNYEPSRIRFNSIACVFKIRLRLMHMSFFRRLETYS